VDDCLTDIQNGHFVSGKNTGQTGGQTGFIFTGNIDKYNFSHGSLPWDGFSLNFSLTKEKP
jgi:hypothetical protein